ncbi:cupin domain-containing protein [Rhodococcus jostii]|uniref:cupin domain-containing protein n=1 Tax=Rhodococcus jostii TaxID=132919 RepID=UPI0003072D33|nr:cupin domain-containing protein [Rhodococcus jostii]
MTHLSWRETRREANWDLPDAEKWGLHRAHYPELVGETFTAHMVQLPSSQSVPERTSDASVVYVGVKGELEFRIGEERIVVGPRDVLTVPNGLPHSCANHDFESALFVSVTTTAEEDDASALSGPHLLPWMDYRRQFRSAILPHAMEYGHHRLSAPHTPLRSLLGHTVRIPTNQASPWHGIPRDLLFVQFSGEVEFSLAGRKCLLEPYDLMLVRARTPYSYANFGTEDGLFFDIGGRILVQGETSTYYESDPGWPINPEVGTYKIVTDDPAFRAIYGSR